MTTNYDFADDAGTLFPTVKVPSTWRREASTSVGTTQTVPVAYSESSSQTSQTTTSEVRCLRFQLPLRRCRGRRVCSDRAVYLIAVA